MKNQINKSINIKGQLINIKRFTPVTFVVSYRKKSIYINEYELRELQIEVRKGLRKSGQEVHILGKPEKKAIIHETGSLSISLFDGFKNGGIQYVSYGFAPKQIAKFLDSEINYLNQ